jgi:hypothetical protein
MVQRLRVDLSVWNPDHGSNCRSTEKEGRATPKAGDENPAEFETA